jgi:hypothetical protein
VNAKRERAAKRAARKGATLKPISETTAGLQAPADQAIEGAEPENPDEGAPAPDSYNLSSELEQD